MSMVEAVRIARNFARAMKCDYYVIRCATGYDVVRWLGLEDDVVLPVRC